MNVVFASDEESHRHVCRYRASATAWPASVGEQAGTVPRVGVASGVGRAGGVDSAGGGPLARGGTAGGRRVSRSVDDDDLHLLDAPERTEAVGQFSDVTGGTLDHERLHARVV